jgi:hypothetical protein
MKLKDKADLYKFRIKIHWEGGVNVSELLLEDTLAMQRQGEKFEE